MLLAEIHGKTRPDFESSEDWLTSAVFGHLRGLPQGVFWARLFGRAKTTTQASPALANRLLADGIDLTKYEVELAFWKSFETLGEPDLLLRFTRLGGPSVIVLIEVKLLSGKSGFGENDQLARYLRILDRSEELLGWRSDHTYLVYLTVSEGHSALSESATAYGAKLALERLFSLHWSDIQEVANQESNKSFLLAEVAKFLARRNLSPFTGSEFSTLDLSPHLGSFYLEPYFHMHSLVLSPTLGDFYGI